jgi:hypothetical protein
MEFHPLDQELLSLLEQAGARGELTPGNVRSRLAKRTRVSAGEVQERIHALWKEGWLTVEPPAPGKREIRLWPASIDQAPPSPSRPEAPSLSESAAQICSQLASAFHGAAHPEAKQEFARLLFNLGAERTDPEGSAAGFMGRRHQCAKPVLPGDPVKVIESGWLLRNCPGELLLSKSRVVPA